MSKNRQIPTTSHPPVSNPPMALKATKMQILSTDKAVFNLAKPVNRGVLGCSLYAVALPDGVDILTMDGK